MPASRSSVASGTWATASQAAPGLERGPRHRDGAVAVAVGLHHRAHLRRARHVAQAATLAAIAAERRPPPTPGAITPHDLVEGAR